MFETGTILRLREEPADDQPNPYERVKVVGPSPIQHVTASGTPWAGQDAVGFILTPEGGFGETVDKPLGLINELYEVESYPTDPATGKPLTPENTPRNLPSPEQVFAATAREEVKQRPKAPSFQDDAKTPEQVLREGTQQPIEKRKPRTPKPKPATEAS